MLGDLAIENFGGGIVVISHNEEFCNRVCKEKWIMSDGNLRREGATYDDAPEVAEIDGVKPNAKLRTHEVGGLYVEV